MARPADLRQRGVALITALVVVAIAAGLAVAIAWQTTLDTRRTANLVQGDQAMEYALGAEAWAEEILARDGRKYQNVTALGQDWAQQLPPLPVEGGQIQGKIEDLQGRFNINNLSTPQGLAQFQRLLTALDQDPTLAAAAQQWFTGTPGGASDATDDYYSRLQPPYLSGGGAPMQSVSELLLVKGITPAVYAEISPYLCALPAGATATVNINTASGPVLESLNANITPDVASQIIGERGTSGFSDLSRLSALSPPIPTTGFGPTSNYFLLTVVAQIGSTHVTLYSLLYRNGSNEVTALRRTFGTL
ncbi:MAG TPA: type II secretion system minor pseudopilin GspK [Gammaproteobacteria bacterium]|nr:type II secretion system minor pseudopilin GspK [Gammaproteobacteria bacterium]